MGQITIKLMHPTDGTLEEREVPATWTGAQLIKELVLTGFIIPSPSGYDLTAVGGAQLSLNRSLIASNIADGSTLRIIPATDAGCFAEDTKLLLANGKTLSITEARTDLEILTYDHNSRTFQESKVGGVLRQTYSDCLEINQSVVMSPDQVLLNADFHWRRASSLEIGDVLASYPFSTTAIHSIKKIEGLRTTVSLTTPSQECFIAGGFIAKDLIGKQAALPRQVDVFLSYASEDHESAAQIFSRLESVGVSVFLDKRSVDPGSSWEREVRQALKSCRHFWLLVTPRSLRSEWVASEWAAAWFLEKPVVPILQGASAEDLPERLRSYQAVDLERLDLLINNLRRAQ